MRRSFVFTAIAAGLVLLSLASAAAAPAPSAGAAVTWAPAGATPSPQEGTLAAAGDAGTASTPLEDADGQWIPLNLVPQIRSGVLGARHSAQKRRLRESAYVLDGGTKVGYYTAPLQLGSPPKTFTLILDTGSSVTVVPCKPCKCGWQQGPQFDLEASPDAVVLKCSDTSFCPKEKSLCAGAPPSSTCEFANRYADGTQNGGMFVRDTLFLPRPGQSPELLKNFVFGCAKYVSGLLYKQYADGLMGLSMGPSALPPQLAAAGIGGRGSAPGTFTLCLSRAGGAMALGKPARPAGAAPLQYVFLQPSPRGFYLVGVQGFTVNGAPLTLTTPASQTILIDSGSTFSYLTFNTYQQLISQLDAALAPLKPPPGQLPRRSLHQVSQRTASLVLDYGGIVEDDGGNVAVGKEGAAPPAGSVFVSKVPLPKGNDDVCWDLTGPGATQIRTEYDLGGVFPDLELTFAGGVPFKLPPYRYVFVASKTKGNANAKPRVTVCLGVFDGNDLAILGAIMMRDTLFEFDWAGPLTKRVGFTQADCGYLASDISRGS